MPRTLLPQTLALGDAGHTVGRFLSMKELGMAEQAGIFDPFCLDCLWGCHAAALSKAVAPWDCSTCVPHCRCPMGKLAKHVLGELCRLRKRFTPLCDNCASGIKAVSPCCLRAVPRFVAPWFGRAALQLGTYRGNPLAVGVRLTCRGGCMNEGACFGLELMGSNRGFMSYMFAPASGRCFHEIGTGVRTLCAQALPRLVAPPGTAAEEKEKVVDAWVRLTPEGGIGFMRQVLGGPVESTGLLPQEKLPDFVQEYHATVHFYNRQLDVPVSASIIYSGSARTQGTQIRGPCSGACAPKPPKSEIPLSVQSRDKPVPDFSAVWYLERPLRGTQA